MDGMRAFAVLCVVVVHCAVFGGALGDDPAGRLLAHLNVGVTVFFLISGFLLYRPFIAHHGGGPAAPDVADYAKRRFLRIFPAYWLALTVLTILPATVGVSDGEWLDQYALAQTLPVRAGAGCTGAPDCGLAQTWSLVVEVTFYAVLPLYALAAAWLTGRLSGRRWLAAELGLLVGLSALSIIAHFYWVESGPRSWLAGSVGAFVFWFALGMGLACASVGLEGRRLPRALEAITSRPLLPWLVAVALYAGLALGLPPTPYLTERGDQVLVHLGFGLIALLLMLPAVFGGDRGGAPRRLLATRVMSSLGLISYGVFLWHYAVALELGEEGAGFAVVLAATLAISIVVGTASYLLLERPLLRLKYRR